MPTVRGVAGILAVIGLPSLMATACTTPGSGSDRMAVQALVDRHAGADLGWHGDGAPDAGTMVSAALAEPLTRENAIRVAMVRSPRLQQAYGELGIAQADVLEAIQISNPHIAVSALSMADGPGTQIAFGIAAPLLDMLTLPARRNLARIDRDRARLQMAAAILGVGLDVEAAWYDAVAARQIADMRAAVSGALQTSADLADRFYAAGNITDVQLSREHAAASEARIEASRTAIAAREARLKLDLAMGLGPSDADWTIDATLPLPVSEEDDPAVLQRVAGENNLDLLAARKGEQVAAGVARYTKAFRLLGSTTVGFDRERETDHSVIRGPTADIELPIFNQGGARMLRANARLQLAHARLVQTELGTTNGVIAGEQRVRALADIVGIYRQMLVPERETVARQSQLQQNYALIGEFEVLQARTQEYEAYQGMIEAVRDYWLARLDLERAIGSRLPSASTPTEPSLTPAQFLAAPAEPPGHHHHGDRP